MTIATRNPPEQGQLVTVRQRRYVVNEIVKSTLPNRPLKVSGNGAQHLITLSSVEDDALGEELQVIWELEPGARVEEKVALPEPTGFDEPKQLDAFLDAVRWGAASSADVKSVQSPFRSGIDIEDYQLDPVVRAIQMPRVNLLIADDVGLGKTIEAGMVKLELVIRNRARRILIVCPASLQIQWRDQMRDKFGLDFRIVDAALMRDLRRKRGIHVNPWMHFPRLITSIDFIKRERPLRLFKETLPNEGESIYPRRYDILVLDEAHNCAPASRGKYATDSLRTQALRLMVPHFEHKLFLTATPHNGYQESFSALLELLDDQRFARGTMPDRKQLGAVMVRRLKSELPKRFDGTDRFPKRIIDAIEVRYTAEEKAVHAALKKYTKLRQQNVADNTEKMATEFVLLTLKKRLFSSPAAFAATLEQHERSLRTAKRRTTTAKPSIGILQRQIEKVEEEYADDTAYEEATDDAVEAAKRSGGGGPHVADASSLKTPEWEIFAQPTPAYNTRDFRLKVVPPPEGYTGFFDKIVLAEKLREVRALIGFTRLESAYDFDTPTELPADLRAPLSRQAPTWVPASEIRGEGIFFHFSEPALRKWEKDHGAYDGEFFNAHKRWRESRGLPKPDAGYPGVRLVLLHTFAHAVIRQLSIECGYTTASIRERIYCQNPDDGKPMAGVLIYTAAADSEGTLGGLCALGRPDRLGSHLDEALEMMRHCASDPLCAERHPGREGVTLHGAACHACTFVPETSCERGNKYLDRSVLVATVERADLAFFE